jgi:hypothetical protein
MFASLLPGSVVATVDAGNLEDVERAVSLRVRGSAPQFARPSDDGLLVPLGRREHMVRDYAASATRQLDVRLYAQWTEEDDWTIRLPPGARLKGLPSSGGASGPFGSYSVQVESTGSALHVRTVVTLAKTRIPAADYPSFRAWCEEVDRALGQRATVALR